jgi:hypothetical protein
MYGGSEVTTPGILKAELVAFRISPSTNSIYGIKFLNKINKGYLNK